MIGERYQILKSPKLLKILFSLLGGSSTTAVSQFFKFLLLFIPVGKGCRNSFVLSTPQSKTTFYFLKWQNNKFETQQEKYV